MRKPTREKKKGGRKREGEREYARTRVRDTEREREKESSLANNPFLPRSRFGARELPPATIVPTTFTPSPHLVGGHYSSHISRTPRYGWFSRLPFCSPVGHDGDDGYSSRNRVESRMILVYVHSIIRLIPRFLSSFRYFPPDFHAEYFLLILIDSTRRDIRSTDLLVENTGVFPWLFYPFVFFHSRSFFVQDFRHPTAGFHWRACIERTLTPFADVDRSVTTRNNLGQSRPRPPPPSVRGIHALSAVAFNRKKRL